MIVHLVLAAFFATPSPKAAKPTAKEIIGAALSVGDLPLSKGEACVSFHAGTVREFLSSQLAVLAESKEGKGRRQGITATCQPRWENDDKLARWRCRMEVFMHTVPPSEDVLGSVGIMFLMDEHKLPLRTWFMCTGSG
jgi:hypothetical protein